MMKIGMLFNKPNREKGQSLVEFAMVLVIILIILSGVIDLGRMFFYYISMRDAAQEGVLYGSAYPPELNASPYSTARTAYCDEIEARTFALLSDQSGSAVVQTTINGIDCDSVGPADACSANMITVTVSDDEFELTMPFIGAFVGEDNAVALHASIHGTILRPRCD